MARKPTGNPTGAPQKGDLVKAKDALTKMSTEDELERDGENPYEGLSERQQIIARFKLRGLSQRAIAKFLGVSQPVISKEMKRIRIHLAKKGSEIDQDAIVGETTSLYEEVEYRAWELYSTGDNGDKAKALSLVMQARDKHTKLLMDLGRLKRAGSTSKVELHVSKLVKDLESDKRKAIVADIVQAHLSKLDEPSPPEEIIDAEIVIEEE